jgi:tRNA pseudouridine38-40 synthase
LADTAFPFAPEPLPAGSRIACRVEYDGSQFCGWQSQHDPAVSTVQDALEAGLAVVADAPVRLHCAGRTDAGVHGFAQIIHFDAPVVRSPKAWVLGSNASLPSAVRLHWAVPVAADFHARFSATARRYRYIIANTPVRPALLGGQIAWQRRPLDHCLMHDAAQYLLGEQDFSAFRAASCQSNSPMRNVHSLEVSRRGELVIVDIKANAFLHHMVRNIVGTLSAVGMGLQPPAWVAAVLAGRDRRVAAETAPAAGLYLVEVEYPQHFGLPEIPPGPLLLGIPPAN